MAAQNSHLEVVNRLLEALHHDTTRGQAILHLSNGNSALDYAALNGDTETLDTFLRMDVVKAHLLEERRAAILLKKAIDADKKANAIYIARFMTANNLNPNEVEGMQVLLKEYRQEMAASTLLFEEIRISTGLPIELSEIVTSYYLDRARTLTPGCVRHICLQIEHNTQPDKHLAPILFCGPGAQEVRPEQAEQEAVPQRARPT